MLLIDRFMEILHGVGGREQIGKKLAALVCPSLAYKTFNEIYLSKFGADSSGRGRGYWLTLLAIRSADEKELS